MYSTDELRELYIQLMCDLGYIIKDHVPAILQLVSSDFPFSTGLIPTKCLNTAVLFLYLFLGKPAFKYSDHCDVPAVQQRYKAVDRSIRELDKFERDLLHRKNDERALFYVMLTDGELGPATQQQPAGMDGTIASVLGGFDFRVAARPSQQRPPYFPGHVFVIEKLPARHGSSPPRFNVYQSYINEYDHKGHLHRNGSLAYSNGRMSALVDGMRHMFSAKAWDKRSNDFWRAFAFADGSPWLGHGVAGRVLFCYARVRTDACVENLRKIVSHKHRELTARWDTVDPDAVYGLDACKLQTKPTSSSKPTAQSCFNLRSNSMRPLSNAEMLSEMQALLRKV